MPYRYLDTDNGQLKINYTRGQTAHPENVLLVDDFPETPQDEPRVLITATWGDDEVSVAHQRETYGGYFYAYRNGSVWHSNTNALLSGSFGLVAYMYDEDSEYITVRTIMHAGEAADYNPETSTVWISQDAITIPVEDSKEEYYWDETPTGDEENPEGLEAIGGEFADRLSLFSDAQEITDLGTPLGITPYLENYYMAFTPYSLTQSDFRMFSAAMWLNASQSGSIWQRIKDLFGGNQNPMSAIISCVDLPLKSAEVNRSMRVQMAVGGIDLEIDNQSVSAYHYLTRYHKIPLGTLTVKETWGTDKDYNSTSCSIYLPYIGFRELDARIIVGSKISLYVTVDYWTGDIAYNLHVEKSSFQNYVGTKFYSYSFSGNCASALPLSEANTNELRGSLLSGISSLATGFVSGGGALLSAGLGLAQNAIKNPITQTSGNLSGNNGLMCLQKAFLMFSRGVPVYPNGWRAEIGAPRSQTLEIASGMGFIKISDIKLEDIDGATDNEVATLQNLLKTEGVIL